MRCDFYWVAVGVCFCGFIYWLFFVTHRFINATYRYLPTAP